jgi:RES domain-containing protein
MCDVIAWEGTVWRIHKRKYATTDPAGSRKISGRYHRGTDQVSESRAWPTLYFSTQPEICLAELFRHITAELFPFLNNYRLSKIELSLEAVTDYRQPDRLKIDPDVLVADESYEVTQSVGSAAYDQRSEGLLVPSATGLGDNLVLFPLNLRPNSRLNLISSRDPRLRPV